MKLINLQQLKSEIKELLHDYRLMYEILCAEMWIKKIKLFGAIKTRKRPAKNLLKILIKPSIDFYTHYSKAFDNSVF